MINVSKFVKDDVPHFALEISKCQKLEKVDQAVQKNINQPSSQLSESLIDRARDLGSSSDRITMGQGEYVIFHKLPSGEKKELSPETFEKACKILLQCSPAAVINSGSENAIETCANRYELITAHLKEIDPTLVAVFIPRTLYELIFIRKCIQEDLKHKDICEQLAPSSHKISLKSFRGDQKKYQEFLEEDAFEKAKRKCWHLCYFSDGENNEQPGLKEVAYRLNKVMLKAFDPVGEGFTQQEFSFFAEKEIEFLKNHHKNGLEILEKLSQGEQVEHVSSCSTPGPTTNFGFESTRGSIKPMGIRNETDAQIIRNAIDLDCSKIAQNSFLLYRGGDFQKDSNICRNDENKPYSLSFGTSLFAGCLYDGGATAFHYMRNKLNAYAIPVPFDQLNDSLFYIPTTHTLIQLFGDGEIFHVRTKAWKDFDVQEIGGMNMGANGHVREHLKSNLKQDEMIEQFRKYKNLAVQLSNN